MTKIINEAAIEAALKLAEKEDTVRVREVLAKAKEKKGLNIEEVAVLMAIESEDLRQALFHTAEQIKDEMYGKRLVIFAPMYISNLCSNDCAYCAFRAKNTALKRRSLSQEEIAEEVKALIDQGHKRLLLVAGESHNRDGFQYILDSIKTAYGVKTDKGEIRRINVNIAPLSLDEFKQLKTTEIGTYQLFQETYHKPTYAAVHISGKKSDYDWRLTAIDRAMQAGIDDVGVGVLFGLADWRFDLLALLQHAAYLDKTYGIGPHTMSVPRLEPASGAEIAANPPHPVSDRDFYKLIAILRLAVPYTGIILSTRETPETRRNVLALGVSQISAGSRTNPGGYGKDEKNAGQFSLGDHRSLDEVIRDVASMGYIPSFCTACYRLGRTGEDFMSLAKPGDIKTMCEPNALATFQEYLTDYASSETKKVGEVLIKKDLENMNAEGREIAEQLIEKIKSGEHDVFV